VTVDLNLPEEFDMPAARLATRRERLVREVGSPPRSSHAGRLAGASRRRTRGLSSPSRGRRTVALALVAAVLAAVAAGAATGVLPVGSEIPVPRVTGESEPRYTSERTVVASGVTSNGLDWRMTVAQSGNQGFCFGLTLLDTVAGDDGMDACGRSSTFDALGLGGGDVLPDTTLVFGPVPEQATAVRITAPGGFARSVTELAGGPDDVPGDFYLAEIPRGLHNVLVYWVTTDGAVMEPGAVVESTIKYTPQPAGPPH
jgi:hypothetical protein